jgi:hypothetical protein
MERSGRFHPRVKPRGEESPSRFAFCITEKHSREIQTSESVMRPLIPTRAHGILDYLVGVLLIVVPWIFGFAGDNAATWVPVFLGAAAIVYSLMTRYELGIFPVLPMTTHLAIDVAAGLFLAVSPWLLGFADIIWWPHLFFGLMEVAAAVLTQRHPTRISARMMPPDDAAHRPLGT